LTGIVPVNAARMMSMGPRHDLAARVGPDPRQFGALGVDYDPVPEDPRPLQDVAVSFSEWEGPAGADAAREIDPNLGVVGHPPQHQPPGSERPLHERRGPAVLASEQLETVAPLSDLAHGGVIAAKRPSVGVLIQRRLLSRALRSREE
jgi:hypothetical protein